MNADQNIKITYIPIDQLKELEGNPRLWTDQAKHDLTESLRKFSLVEPLVVNYNNVVLGGNFRLDTAKRLGYKEVPCVYVNIRDEDKARELSLRLNRNQGQWNWSLLSEFSELMLADVGFTSEEIDSVFDIDTSLGEEFDLEKELAKLDITSVNAKSGDIYKLGESRLMVGDSTIAADVTKLMRGDKADMAICDEPYITASNYKGGIRHGNPTTDKGPKRSRRYLETEEMPENFTALWLDNIANIVAKPDFSLIAFEAWYNLRVLWGEVEKHMTVKNMLIWNIPKRNQAFAASYKFFSKYDIAVIGAQGTVEFNDDDELDGLQQTYETALYAIQGKPNWEKYEGPKKQRPTDHVELDADDKKNSGQGVIFGTKPLQLLQPYIKILTKRGDLVCDLFCGSGSTLIASVQLNRRCYTMEKSPVYAEIAMRRWEIETGLKREKLS